MEGITILATEIITKPAPWAYAFMVCFAILGAIGFFCVISSSGCDSMLIVGLGLLIIGFFGALLGALFTDHITVYNYTQYEVIIDDSVSFTDFNKEYEILEQRGQIYVIKEIEE